MSQLAHAVRRSPRWARLAACAVLAALGALALIWIGRASANEVGPAAVSKAVSNVPIGKADAVDANVGVCTSSTPFGDMPGMSVTFKLAGTTSRPVLVLFQGSWFLPNIGAIMEIRLTIDGVVQSVTDNPDAINRQFSQAPPNGTHGFNFVSDPVAPGTHTARIQWKNFSSTAPGCINDRSLIVLHK